LPPHFLSQTNTQYASPDKTQSGCGTPLGQWFSTVNELCNYLEALKNLDAPEIPQTNLMRIFGGGIQAGNFEAPYLYR
jgi:hypothetical protein